MPKSINVDPCKTRMRGILDSDTLQVHTYSKPMEAKLTSVGSVLALKNA